MTGVPGAGATLLSSPGILASPAVPSAALGPGETALFWVLAPLMVLAALGLLVVKKAVHAALLVAFVMIGLAMMYAAQDAPFLFAAQVVVYTGAVMMLFLFVLMLVGVDASDSLVETIRGQRWLGLLLGAGIALVVVGSVRQLVVREGGFPAARGLEAANADGNPVGVARLIFGDFVLPFQLTGALLITAAVGAIVLTHRERLVPRVTQRTLSQRRVREGRQVTPLPAPGVFARHNAVDTPALLPDGTPSELSVSRVLRARGQQRSVAGLADDVDVVVAEISPGRRGITGSQSPDDEAADARRRTSDADLPGGLGSPRVEDSGADGDGTDEDGKAQR